MWGELEQLGRAGTGGYRRYAWTPEDARLREWFAGQSAARGLDLVQDRAGNQWAWWGDPDADGPGVAVGSHLDSVPDGGAFDGPLGVVSALAAVDALRESGVRPTKPLAVVHFGDEEGARFGIACAGSRLLTGALDADRARGLTDGDGVRMAEAMAAAGLDVSHVGRDDETLRRIDSFVELHVEQGRAMVDMDAPVAVGSAIRPHGRWRYELPGEANHAGTTLLADRRDPMLAMAAVVLAARAAAVRHDTVATCGKLRVEPNGVNAIPSRVTGWLDARGPVPEGVLATVADVTAAVEEHGGRVEQESWTGVTRFDADLAAELAGLLGGVPVLDTGAGHDAGILSAAGVRTAMLFVRNPTGVSHSPLEHAEPDDCEAGVRALSTVLASLVG
ncbi:allantoate amidohydrolase [Pseudonocardia humida]|uniref:Allantoate amidohydrolase n=1 Tax=Pseudonocardia humida TaxID=2800819 RepID=A0ABT1A389_9PSEU|nr:allantoate amidohydrolase [Pseudonocardia humida]MCO1657474.1 allantoate amidohydrolase [Pseudonocardia humida]